MEEQLLVSSIAELLDLKEKIREKVIRGKMVNAKTHYEEVKHEAEEIRHEGNVVVIKGYKQGVKRNHASYFARQI